MGIVLRAIRVEEQIRQLGFYNGCQRLECMRTSETLSALDLYVKTFHAQEFSHPNIQTRTFFDMYDSSLKCSNVNLYFPFENRTVH